MLPGNNNQPPFGNMPRSGPPSVQSYLDMSVSGLNTGTSAAHIGGPTGSSISCPNMSPGDLNTGTSSAHISGPISSGISCPNMSLGPRPTGTFAVHMASPWGRGTPAPGNGSRKGIFGKLTAPNPSFGASGKPSIVQLPFGQGMSCCYTPSMVFPMNPTPPFAGSIGMNTGRAALPNCLLPSVNELLSPRPPFPTRTSQERSPKANRAQNSDHSPRHSSQSARMSTRAPSSSSDVSGLSTTSSRTIQGPPSIEERRYILIVTLYRICLEAAATYANSIRRPGHRRSAQDLARGGRYHPYSQSSLVPPRWRSHRTHGAGEQTLMDYISVICTLLWRRARTDLISPHEAEAVAVREMRNLYSCSEAMIRHVENQDPENDVGESGSESGDMGSLADGITDQRAGINATQLCQYFRDREALIACERVCLELRDLSKEARRMRATAASRSDAFGNIF